MVKTIRIVLEDSEHAKFDAIKGDKTWYAVLMRGIESLAFFPSEMDWGDLQTENPQYLHIMDEDGNLK